MMRKVNLFEELLSERNKEISSDELKSIVKKYGVIMILKKIK